MPMIASIARTCRSPAADHERPHIAPRMPLRLRSRAGVALASGRNGTASGQVPRTPIDPGRCAAVMGYPDRILEQNTVTVELPYDERDNIVEEAESRDGRVERE